MTALIIVAVALGGACGAPSRFLLDRFVADHLESDLPWATFAVNVSGSLLLGFLTGLDAAGHLPMLVKALLGTGFCGAYTTFSTWTFETVRLLEQGEFLEGAGNALVSLVVGLGAAGLGLFFGLKL